jgi:Na+/H+-dicarboxylate symporter
MAVCCTVHTLLLTGGIAGIGAARGAATDNITLLLLLLLIAVGVAAIVIGIRLVRLRPPGQSKVGSRDAQSSDQRLSAEARPR